MIVKLSQAEAFVLLDVIDMYIIRCERKIAQSVVVLNQAEMAELEGVYTEISNYIDAEAKIVLCVGDGSPVETVIKYIMRNAIENPTEIRPRVANSIKRKFCL